MCKKHPSVPCVIEKPDVVKGVTIMFDKIRAGIAVVALLGCTVTTAAEARDLRPYVSPQVRLIAADDDRNTHDAYGAEVSALCYTHLRAH